MTEARLTIMPVPNGGREPERSVLKQEFLHCLDQLAEVGVDLRRVVLTLLGLGVNRQELVQWAVEAGYSASHVRSLLSRLFCDAGGRCRKPGAGRRTPKEALALLAFAREQYGERAARFLRAAYRAAKSQAVAHAAPAEASDPVQVTNATLAA